jgi:chitinase
MMKKVLNNSILILIGLVFSTSVLGQLPNPAMVGYWENWKGTKFVELKNIDSRYNVIQVSFTIGLNGKDYDLGFSPAYDEAEFRADMQALQADGKKVLISIGGQNDPIMLDSLAEKDIFISSLTNIINDYGFDGLDIDLEGSSVKFNQINIQTPGDIRMLYMIDGIRQVMTNYHSTNGKKLLLTMAPETAYVQGGLSSWAVNNAHGGAYLPIIEALRDSIDMLNVQIYNSGTQYGIDGIIYKQGTISWALAMTEAVIHGFKGKGNLGTYSGFPANKVGVALPGCDSYDAIPHKEMEALMRYLTGKGPQPNSYKLIKDEGYPNLRGMMTWSINSDRICNPNYGFVDTWSKVFTDSPYMELKTLNDVYEGNEDGSTIQVNLFNCSFESNLDTSKWEIINLPEGVEINSIEKLNDTTANIELKGNSTNPYVQAKFNVTVTIDSTELVNSSQHISRNRGVVLKPNPSPIPGKLELEKYITHHGVRVENISSSDGSEKYARTNTGSWLEIEVDVAQDDEYSLDFRYRSHYGSHEIKFKVDGTTKKTFAINSSTNKNKWENDSFKINLTEGKHILKFNTLHSGSWYRVHIDWIDFVSSSSSSLGNGNVNALKQTRFYPNPSSETISFNSEKIRNVRFYSLSGKLVKEVLLENSNQINISDLKTGIYTIQTENSSGILYYDKLIKK